MQFHIFKQNAKIHPIAINLIMILNLVHILLLLRFLNSLVVPVMQLLNHGDLKSGGTAPSVIPPEPIHCNDRCHGK